MLTPSRRRCFVACAVAASFAAAPFSMEAAAAAPFNRVFSSTQNAAKCSPGESFPLTTAEALDRAQLQLPAGFEGRENLLLLSWERDQGPQLDTWTPVAQALQHSDFRFRVYRMLVSAPENMLFRWWDNASLRAEQTDPLLLHWEVPLYVEKSSFAQCLGISGDPHQVAAVLVDRSGKVLWRAQGASTEQTRKSLLTAAQDMR